MANRICYFNENLEIVLWPMTSKNQDATEINIGSEIVVDPNEASQGCSDYHRLSPKWASIPMCNGRSYYDQAVKSRSEVKRWFNKDKRRELGEDYYDVPGTR